MGFGGPALPKARRKSNKYGLPWTIVNSSKAGTLGQNEKTPFDAVVDDPLWFVEEIERLVVREYAMAVSDIHFFAKGCDERIKSILLRAAERLHGLAIIHRALQLPIDRQLNLYSYPPGVSPTWYQTSLAGLRTKNLEGGACLFEGMDGWSGCRR